MEQVWDSVNRARPAKWRETENEMARIKKW